MIVRMETAIGTHCPCCNARWGDAPGASICSVLVGVNLDRKISVVMCANCVADTKTLPAKCEAVARQMWGEAMGRELGRDASAFAKAATKRNITIPEIEAELDIPTGSYNRANNIVFGVPEYNDFMDILAADPTAEIYQFGCRWAESELMGHLAGLRDHRSRTSSSVTSPTKQAQ